ncbi:MAG: transglutaminase family protein [Hoeflea sp.]|uniref:transglutaminase family protein n=1 Tax=Hoeflea sp. TaxID=1940281 RepID=UPI0032EBB52C
MLYDIKFALDYAFEAPAAGARQILRAMPLSIPGRQRLISGAVSVSPHPSNCIDRSDFFGNAVTEMAFSEACRNILISLDARVEVTAGAEPMASVATLPELREAIGTLRDLGSRSPMHFLAASRYTPDDPGIRNWAAAGRSGGRRKVSEIVSDLGQAINNEMRFDAGATTVETPAAEAFEARHGVCQDFTHIMIIGLRGLGIPSGYVSGYLRTLPPPGRPRLEGADAMHAWVCAWCGPDTGWIEYDPTNATFAGTDHIVVGYGRDYADIAPIRGAIRTAGGHASNQSVDVIPVEP